MHAFRIFNLIEKKKKEKGVKIGSITVTLSGGTYVMLNGEYKFDEYVLTMEGETDSFKRTSYIPMEQIIKVDMTWQ